MEILLVVATLVVGVAVLYVTATFSMRTRQNTAPLIDAAAKDVSGQIETAVEDLRRQLQVLTDELQRDRDQTRFEGRKVQGRLDHADSRLSSVEGRLLAELETIRHLSEQIDGRQDQLSGDLRQLDHQVARLTEAAVQFPPAGHPDEETAGEEPAEVGALGRFYAERLRFSIVRIPPESFPRFERQFRILVERAVGELPSPRLDSLGGAPAITERAKNDQGFRERLGQAAADYLATKAGDTVFAAATERWVTQNTFPQAAAPDACHRIGRGLDAIVARPLEQTGAEIRLPGIEAATAAGIGSAYVLQPVTGPLGELTTFLEITGVAVGTATGLDPLALASTRMLAHDQFHDLLAQGLAQAARQVFQAREGPEAVPGSARPVDEVPGVSRPVNTGPGPG